jgi:hypothetical protein
MCPSNTLPATILETILARVATLFLTGAGGDTTTARHARPNAPDHDPETAEPRLAANIVSFQAREALARAATPDRPLPRALPPRQCLEPLPRVRDSRTPSRPTPERQPTAHQTRPADIQPVQLRTKIDTAFALIQDTQPNS